MKDDDITKAVVGAVISVALNKGVGSRRDETIDVRLVLQASSRR